jgi:hypothetical protein
MLTESGDGRRRVQRVEFFVERTPDGLAFGGRLPTDDDIRAPVPDPLDVMHLNASWRWLSPLELRVVRLLCRAGWLSREEIATQLGEAPEGNLPPILSNLVARGVLESSPRKGYSVALPDDAKPEQYRRDLAAWLDARAELGDRPPIAGQ